MIADQGGSITEARRLSDRALGRLLWAGAAFTVVGAVAGVALDLASGGLSDAGFGLLLLSFPTVGFVIVRRRPRATLGWLMLSLGFVGGLPLESYARYALETRGGELPFGPQALALSGPTWIPFIAISGYLLLLFPDGHLPSLRWRWFSWACGVGLGILAIWIWVAPGNFAESGYPEIVNPWGIEALRPFEGVGLSFALFAPLLVLGGAAGIVLRLRRTNDDVVRHQLRWLAYSAALIASLYALAFIPGISNADWGSGIQALAVLSFVLIPITIGVAVLRYRLYDIDIVIRKTVVFAVLAAFIAVVYTFLVVGVGAVVGSSGNTVLSALAAAVVAIAFQPVARRARRIADQVVYGRRATPYEVLAQFGDQLSGSYSSDDVLPRTARVLAEGVGAERARVWLTVGDGLRPVASWPSDGSVDREDDYSVEVRYQGELLGELSLAMPANDPMNPAKEKLVQDLAGQAGLVLSNVRLTEQLRARLADLQAAQKRLVAAQDHERRKLERNIHDGAQQQLVALTVKLRLAEGLVERDPEKVTQMLGQLRNDTQTALEDLRNLARGIYPPLLADQGLTAALESQVRRSPVPVVIEADGIGRYPQEIEAAVYFSCLEALQNIAKYAEASQARVTLTQRDDRLIFSVSDDGRGFDRTAVSYGTGLQGISDRLGALDGALEVESTPGEGTRLTGRIEVSSPASVSV